MIALRCQLALLCLGLSPALTLAQTAAITVTANTVLRTVDDRHFGANSTAWDGALGTAHFNIGVTRWEGWSPSWCEV
jgi:hypothetical protein